MQDRDDYIAVVTTTTEKCGTFKIYIQGTKPKNAPILLTVPDLGCDHSYYTRFVNAHFPGRFCWCHIELPGQSFCSPDWSTDFDESSEATSLTQSAASPTNKSYPTMQELAEGVRIVMEKMEINQAILFGEGAGANLLSRVAILCDSRVLGLLLIHGRCTPSGPLNLLREKMRNWKSGKLEPATEKYLLEHRYSTVSETGLPEALKQELRSYKENLISKANIKNLNLLTYSYAHRKSMAEMLHLLNCPVLLISGTMSDHRAGVRNMFETINKANKNVTDSRIDVELIEIEGVRSPLVEKPEKVAEIALYFFQGLGLITSSRSSITSHSGDTSVSENAPATGSPGKRTCAELVNLDPAPGLTSLSTHSGDTTDRKISDIGDRDCPLLPQKYFGRQMSMVELDLPRGADALSSMKLLCHGVNTPPQPSHL
ncbi:unnamed protein product [Dicrocoelium dendriticum]|nr:unnamed protein product [Dicrocoelium dendriticum]